MQEIPLPVLRIQHLWMSLLGALVFTQLVLPLRPYYFSSYTNWSEEGHRMSWRMMLRSKSGWIRFTVKDLDSDQSWDVKPSATLTRAQRSSLATHPDMIWQYCQRLKQEYRDQGYKHISIYVRSRVSLNGAKHKPLIDPDTDMAQVSWSTFQTSDWILPYQAD